MKIFGMMLVVVALSAASESTRVSTRVCLEPHDNSAVVDNEFQRVPPPTIRSLSQSRANVIGSFGDGQSLIYSLSSFRAAPVEA